MLSACCNTNGFTFVFTFHQEVSKLVVDENMGLKEGLIKRPWLHLKYHIFPYYIDGKFKSVSKRFPDDLLLLERFWDASKIAYSLEQVLILNK